MINLPDGSFPAKEMEAMRERLNKTLVRIFSKIIAKKYSSKSKKDVYCISKYDIESNGTKRPKTIRMLRYAGVLTSSRKALEYSSYILWDFKDIFKKHSKDYGVPEEFPDEPVSVTNHLQSTQIAAGLTIDVEEGETFDNIGYRNVNDFSNLGAIYLVWHEEEYVKDTKEDGIFFFPKALLLNRQKAVLKAVLRKFSEEDFPTFLEKNFGSGDTYKDQGEIEAVIDGGLTQDVNEAENGFHSDDKFELTLRNFSRYPVTLDQFEKCFESKKGYINEYEKANSFVTEQYNRIKRLKEKVDAAGGTYAVFIAYIKECIQEIINKAPTLINGGDLHRAALQYILDNRENFNYDFIFSRRQ